MLNRGLLLLVFAWMLGTGCPSDDQPPPAPIDNPPGGSTTTPPDQSSPPPARVTATISGRLSVQFDADVQVVLEQEPNNSLATPHFVAQVVPGDRFSIFGEVAASRPDRLDAFEFAADVPLRISFELTHLEEENTVPPGSFHLAIYDFTHFACARPGSAVQDFAACFAAAQTPTTGTFDAQGPFILVVSLTSGSTQYQLNVNFSAATGGSDANGAGDPRAQRTAGEAIDAGVDESGPGEIIVQFDPTLTPAEQDVLLATRGMRAIERSPSGFMRVEVLPGQTKSDTRQRRLGSLAALRAAPGVRNAETNDRRYIARTPNDPHFALQWHYNAINLPGAWDLTTGSDDVIVAVIDTGIASAHPDFQGRLVAGYDFISDPTSARDGNARDSDPEDAGDLFGGPGQSSFHGTHVAGTIAAATDNGVGVSGAMWAGKIMPLRSLGMNGGTTFDLAEAIRYAAGLPNISGTLPARAARVINLSLSGGAGVPAAATETAAISDAVAAGVLIVGAAGNEGTSLPSAPASLPQVICVSAVDVQLSAAPYANFGPTIDLVAPGGFNGTDLNGDGYADGILSTGASDRLGTVRYEYLFSNGTSMAVPQVAGVAALVMAANPALSAAQVRAILESTARDLGPPGRDDDFGHGLIDAAAAVREALRLGGTTPNTSPILSVSSTALDFGSDRTTLRVRISNAGGGMLTVLSATTTEVDGGGWLQATLSGSATNANAESLVVTVDRTSLAAGTYKGTVTLTAESLPPVTIDVQMSVGQATPTSEIIYVLVVRPPPSLSTVAQAETTAAGEFRYSVPDLVPNTYAVYAGTDRNDDGFICDPGDLCGALPSLLEPAVIGLTIGQDFTADFGVAQRVLQQQAPAAKLPQHLKRLR